MRRELFPALVAAAMLACLPWAQAADQYGLEKGTPDIKSAGPLAFAPDGILLVGDTKGAVIYALATGDKSGEPDKVQLHIEGLNQKAAEALGVSPQDLQINDLAANPQSGNLYLSTSAKGRPAVLKVDASGKISELPLKNIPFSQAKLPNPPEDKVTGQGRRRRNQRGQSITDLAFHEGRVLISGLSSGESPSTVYSLNFPFNEAEGGTNLEIYHGAHGRVEDHSPIRTFVPFHINGEPNLLAGFVCTPLVKFPIKQLEPNKKIRGTTVAELGNRNRPLDMIVYKQNGKHYLLLTNSSRGVMKISTENIEKQEGINKRIGGGGTAGLPYETIKDLQNVVQMDKLNEKSAVILVQKDSGALDLKTVPLP